MLRVRVNLVNLRRSIAGSKKSLNQKETILDRVGRAVVRYTRQTITQQGRNTPWAPLAPSTRFFSGKHKALLALRPNIKHRRSRAGVEVYFVPLSPKWTLSQHEMGFTSPAVRMPKGKSMKAGVARGNARFFKTRKASVIPGRRVWPSAPEVSRIAGQLFSEWVQQGFRKNWR